MPVDIIHVNMAAGIHRELTGDHKISVHEARFKSLFPMAERYAEYFADRKGDRRGLAGLPPHASVAIVATLLVAVLQTLAGLWLTWALIPRQ